jgi:intraflagellar transport protein 88
VRVNAGNVHYASGEFPAAIKQYRMALDRVSAADKETRAKITRNIACAFARMGQYTDAASTFEDVADLNAAAAATSSVDGEKRKSPDVVTLFNLVVCHYAAGDAEKMRRAFLALLSLRAYESDEEDEANADIDAAFTEDAANAAALRETAETGDALRAELRERRRGARDVIMRAARLVGPEIAATSELGYAMLADAMRKAGYVSLANELEMAKALGYLRLKSTVSGGGAFEEGRATLTAFETKDDPAARAGAAANLAFLYLQEGDAEKAAAFADAAVAHDKYDARALVNKGCVLLNRGDEKSLLAATACFENALALEADCVEAQYNLGLARKRLGDAPAAIAAFEKVRDMVPDTNDSVVHVEALYHIADLCDVAGDARAAVTCFEKVAARVANDPGVFARLGDAHAKNSDDQKALSYYQEAHRAFPCDVDVLAWLGTFHARCERFEKACGFFDKAAESSAARRARQVAARRGELRAQERRRRRGAAAVPGDARRVPGRRGVPQAPRARLRGPRHGRGRQAVRREASRRRAREREREKRRRGTRFWDPRRRPSPSRRRTSEKAGDPALWDPLPRPRRRRRWTGAVAVCPRTSGGARTWSCRGCSGTRAARDETLNASRDSLFDLLNPTRRFDY